MSVDNKHQKNPTRYDKADPKENLPTPANITRALEVAEELLQAIKQATPTPLGNQFVLELIPANLAYRPYGMTASL